MKYSIFALIATASGIAAAMVLKWPALIWLLSGLAFLSITMVGFIYHRSTLGWSILIGITCLGAFYFAFRQETYKAGLLWNQNFDNRPVAIEGIVVTRVERTPEGHSRFTIEVPPPADPSPRGRLTIYYAGIMPETYYGRRLRFIGKFKAVREEASWYPGFSEMHGLSGRMTVATAPQQLLKDGLPWCIIWAERFRRHLVKFGCQTLRPSEYQLLHGMIFGEDLPSDVSGQQLKREFRRTGTVHLLTVSGLHVGFIVFGLNLLLTWCRVPKRWRFFPLALGVWFYIMMTGMESPVLRAGIMLLVYMAGELLGVQDDALNRLCLAGGILLLINPYNLVDPSFQLSFTATLGVVWLYPMLKKMFPFKYGWLNPVWQVILLSIAAQLVFLPIVVHYFQQISWGSAIVNVLICLPAQFVVMVGFCGELIGLIMPGLGRIVLIGVGWNLTLIQAVVHYASAFPWISSWSPIWPWPWEIGYYLGLILLLDWLQPNLLTKERQINQGTALLVILIVLNGIVWLSFSCRIGQNCLEVCFIDVGQGDAILLRGPRGGTILVDAGDEGRGQSRVLPLLRQNGIEKLDLVLGTHGHRDHLGGLDEVLSEVAASVVYLPSSIDFKATTVRQMVIELRHLGIPVCKVKNGTEFRLDHSVRGEIFCDPAAVSENDRSLVIVIHYGKNKLILTGDLGSKGEENIKNYATRLRAGGMKVGHHGSNYASTISFLTQVQPDFAVISVGADNRFGHPGPKTINRLNSLGIKLFRTDYHGLIRLKMYPDKTVVISTKGGLL